LSVKTVNIKVGNMVCTSCESLITDKIKDLGGILEVKASYKKSSVFVKFDDSLCSYAKICSAIENAGYSIETELTKDNNKKDKPSEYLSIIGIILIAFIIIRLSQNSGAFDMSSKLGENTTYLMLFVVGLLTSLHCVGMCGGIMMSQSITIAKSKAASLKPSIMYNAGRVVSYTILGGIVGALGSVFSLNLTTQASIAIIAGIFMVIMGFNMAGFSAFRGITLKLPWSKCNSKKSGSTPFVVGLLNGFMPCGPLQTMQLYALASGSAVKGATSMFIFAIGTVPLMLGFGLMANLMSQSNTKKLLKFSGVIVIVLGIVMANRGLTLFGVNLSPMALMSGKVSSENVQATDANKAKIVNGVQEVRITADASGYNPNVVFVQKGIPTKFIVEGKTITSCNNEIIIPTMNIRKKLSKGENIIEFTPGDKDINYSCWMGMISGLIKVVDNIDGVSQSDITDAQNSAPPSSAGGCCASDAVGGAATEPQIYGVPISEVPTERLVKKAEVSGDTQTLAITGIGPDFEPLIAVLGTGVNSKITFDLSKMTSPDGEYSILDINYNKVNSFKIAGSKGEFQGTFDKAGTYLILRKDQLVLSFEVVDSMDNVDLEQLRSEFIY
jgi:sulfite exporter TauE/SafE/plastocyanin domain-containing protein/copper chaperone CopZ